MFKKKKGLRTPRVYGQGGKKSSGEKMGNYVEITKDNKSGMKVNSAWFWEGYLTMHSSTLTALYTKKSDFIECKF